MKVMDLNKGLLEQEKYSNLKIFEGARFLCDDLIAKGRTWIKHPAGIVDVMFKAVGDAGFFGFSKGGQALCEFLVFRHKSVSQQEWPWYRRRFRSHVRKGWVNAARGVLPCPGVGPWTAMMDYRDMSKLAKAEIAELGLLQFALAKAFIERIPRSPEIKPMSTIRLNDGQIFTACYPYRPIPEYYYAVYNRLLSGQEYGVEKSSSIWRARLFLDEQSGRFEIRKKKRLMAEFIVVRNGKGEAAWEAVVQRLRQLDKRGLQAIAPLSSRCALSNRWVAYYLYSGFWNLPKRGQEHIGQSSLALAEVFFQANA